MTKEQDKMDRSVIQKLVEDENLFFFGIVSTVQNKERFKSFTKWLEAKKNAKMSYLEKNLNCRKQPSILLEKSKSVIICGFNYYQGDRYTRNPSTPKIAQYARIKDYHKFLDIKGNKIVENLKKVFPELEARICIDKLPILERSFAEKTLNGFIGKNTMFIHPNEGSYFLLFEIILNIPLPFDKTQEVKHNIRKKEGGCGTCRRCIVYCPTGALDQEYTLDANKCLSYHTIESREVIPIKYWKYLKLSLFGCDICQQVCPYNKKAKVSKTLPKILKKRTLIDIVTMNQKEYESYFGGFPVTRAKISGLKRNALIAMVVTKDPLLEKALNILNETKELEKIIQETIKQIPLYYLSLQKSSHMS